MDLDESKVDIVEFGQKSADQTVYLHCLIMAFIFLFLEIIKS